MPFIPENTSLYSNFGPNDLLYGLMNVRMDYLEPLRKKLNKKDITVDGINDRILRTEDFTKGYNEETILRIDDNTSVDATYQNHLFGHNNFNPFLKTPAKSKRSGEELRTVRACKAAITCPAVKTIHFCLDKINMQRVVDKIDDEDKRDKSYTSSELRYCYRNWSTIKDKVIFYRKGEPCLPPWEQNQVLWDTYKPKSWQDSSASELTSDSESTSDSELNGKEETKEPDTGAKKPRVMRSLLLSFNSSDSEMNDKEETKEASFLLTKHSGIFNSQENSESLNSETKTPSGSALGKRSILQMDDKAEDGFPSKRAKIG